jgi:L-iditol 2-dehydrogenase
MRSVQLVAPRRLEERPMPQPPDPAPGEVAVRLRAVGICGSDLHWYLEGAIGSACAVYPQVLGHEPAGEIVALGRGVNDLKLGQKVSIEPSITCGHCEYCLAGFHNNCLNCVFMGSPRRPGLFLECAVVPARNVEPFPAEISFVHAALIEPLAVMMHVRELVDLSVGETVAILGAGPIGMLCASMARIAGASRIFIADKVRHRLELARKMGADVTILTTSESVRETVLDATRGRGVDVVFEAAGAAETINAGITITRPGGRFVLIGIPSEKNLNIDLLTAMDRELRVQTIKRSNHKGHSAVELLKSGRIPDALITHRLPLEKTPDAFEMLAAYADGVGKVVIEI